VTPSGTASSADVGLARGGDGILHVIWAGGTTAGHRTIEDTPIAASGKAGKPVTIASGLFLVTDPDATATAAGLDAFWNGIKDNAPNSPEGTFEATRPVRGGRWSLAGDIPPLPAVPFTSSSDSAGTGSDGKPWVAFTGTSSLAVVHLGHPEVQIPPKKCCVFQPGFATDGSSGVTWLAYQSLIPHNEGIFAQRMSQATAAGSPARLPGSVTQGNSLVAHQRIGITGRGHGRSGVYASYESGYPFPKALNVIRLGSSKPVKLASFTHAEQLGGDSIEAGPNGKLWAAWFFGLGTPPGLFVRASSNSAKRFGKTVKVKLPAGTEQVLKVYVSAQAKRADVLVLLIHDGSTAYWATQVPLPS
jgi:hypothetical protein